MPSAGTWWIQQWFEQYVGMSVELCFVDSLLEHCLLHSWTDARSTRALVREQDVMSSGVSLINIAIMSALMTSIASASAPMITPALMATRVSMGVWRAGSPARLHVVVETMFIPMDSAYTAFDVDVLQNGNVLSDIGVERECDGKVEEEMSGCVCGGGGGMDVDAAACMDSADLRGIRSV